MFQQFRTNLDLGPSTVNFPPPEGKNPDAAHVVQTSNETAHLYRYVEARMHRQLIPMLIGFKAER